MNFNKELIIKIIAILVVFLALDYLVHYLGFLPKLNTLEEGYWIGKIIGASILLFVGLTFFSKMKPVMLAFIIAFLLQLYRYFNIYDTTTNILMITLHTLFIFAGFWAYEEFGDKLPI